MKNRPRVSPAIDPRFAPFALKVLRSRIQGWGVYAARSIPAHRKVIEYTGERLTFGQARRRLIQLCRNPRTRRLSIFRLNRYWRIDGAFGGSGAEFINHSCEPNLKVRRIRGHILLFSLRRIREKEELTFDYRLSPNTFKIACRCGSPRCRKTLNFFG
ncbi:MAG TPA: SET domain-containing protein-lysine N-methyltransferase [Verrucomicrobiae bacterium]|nr:SET domain-containing protein-lysine N-methyltransferase [Verrucomicrobiae bacterium]